MAGHGKPNIKVTKVPANIPIREQATDADKATESIANHATAEGREAQRCQRQHRRLQQIIDRLKRKAAHFPNNHKKQEGYRARTTVDKSTLTKIHNAMNRDAVNNIIKNLNTSIDDEADLVMGCRGGVARPMLARVGTAVCVALINRLWRTWYRDLGPFRAIRRTTIDRLEMSDKTYGWTIEMQVKAAEANVRVLEVPIAQRARLGRSKISGTLGGTMRAGTRMLATIWSLWRSRRTRGGPG